MTRPKRIILVVIDTLRADHLGCHGYGRDTTPALDALALDGVLFTNAFSACPFTLPSVASILTSRYPSRHGIGLSQVGRLDADRDITLAELLRSRSYATAAFVSSMVLRRDTGLDAGFDVYDDAMTAHELNRDCELIRDGAQTLDRAIAWAEANLDRDFFLFLHLFDAHGPYVCPPPYSGRYVEDALYVHDDLLACVPDDRPVGGIPAYQVLRPERDAAGNLAAYEKNAGYYVSQYDGCIRYCDGIVARLVARLKELGAYDDAAIVVTSDHGEAMGEHGVYFYHGLTVTPEQVRVPLIVKPCRGPKGRAVQENAGTVDIMSTILAWCGIDAGRLGLDGEPLPEVAGGGRGGRALHCENEFQEGTVLAGRLEIHGKRYPEKTSIPLVRELVESLDGKSLDLAGGQDGPEWTGERYLPYLDVDVAGAEIHYEHLHRYAYASRLVRSKKVLDLACGEGYGSRLLSREAESVTGIDVDPAAIRHARRKYPAKNLDFIEGSILDIPIEGERIFDAIVCFEAIEHVEEHDRLMAEAKRLLRDDGFLVVSTPNKKEYSDDSSFNNPFHLKELYLDEFEELLRRYFKNYALMGQAIYPGSEIWPLAGGNAGDRADEILIEKGRSGFKFTENGKVPRYYIALASDAGLPDAGWKSFLTDTSGTVIGQARKNAEACWRQLAERDAQLAERDAQLAAAADERAGLRMKIEDLEEIIFAHKEAIAGKDAHIENIEALLREEERKLDDIRRSITWKAVTGYQKMVNVALPPASRRGKAYGMGLKGIRALADGSIVGALRRQKGGETKAGSPASGNKVDQPPAPEPAPPEKAIAGSISVVIPTKNAGPDFEFTLEKIRGQKGVPLPEIILVDSGSTDGTGELAGRYGAVFHGIPPEEFNHGGTRNLGAEKARGDYVLFMVQDAIPASDRWLYDMARALEADPGIAAVTCRQLPRCDSDLFADFSLWSHYRSLGFSGDRIAGLDGRNLSDLSPLEKRRTAGLEDTCSLVRRDVFSRLRFKEVQYAEDLDLGLRLVGENYRIAFLHSAAVIHSHNRSPEYFLKRAFVDNKVLPGILAYSPPPADSGDAAETLGGLLALYAALNATLESLDPALFEGKAGRLFDAFRRSLGKNLGSGPARLAAFARGHGPLDRAFGDLEAAAGRSVRIGAAGRPGRHYISLVDDFQQYMESRGASCGKKQELAEAFYKLFGIAAGSALAAYCLGASRQGDAGAAARIDGLLSAGI